jgi:hypothetical protein
MVATHNIADDLEPRRASPSFEELGAACILDAGWDGVSFTASNVLARNGSANGRASRSQLTAGPHAHWAKLAFEHVDLASRKRGARGHARRRSCCGARVGCALRSTPILTRGRLAAGR